jgi:tRNA(Ile)-lysidine synthase
MASSRSSAPAEPAAAAPDADRSGPAAAQRAAEADDPVAAAVRAAIAPMLGPQRGGSASRRLVVAVALSGGRDSMVLLDALDALAAELPFTVAALHVHHGLSPNADAWAAFCAEECARRSIPLAVHRARVERAPGESLEATARAARYAAFAAADADVVALAHHADDQAETLLLQLLRGAGPHGLAAMPARRVHGAAAIVRPLLALPRAALQRRADERGLAWIDDESNADTGLRRNYLRHEIVPRLAAVFPGYPATLVRAAAHSAEAAQLLDELAALDAGGSPALFDPAADADPVGADPGTLDRATLAALARRSPARARNLLRWFLRRHVLPPPSTARLAAMLEQLLRAPPDARVRLAHAGVELGIFRGRVVVHAPAVAAFALAWLGEPELALPHGVLEFAPERGAGLAAGALAAGAVTVRRREGGERLRVAADRPGRALKRLLHDAGIPPWQRASLPLVYCGATLAAVPGIGIDATLRAAGDAPGIVVRWHPAHRG